MNIKNLEVEAHVICVLPGNIETEPDSYAKYRYFVQALERQFASVRAYGATLQGLTRIINGLLTVHPDIKHWRERFKKNEFAFRARSHRVATYLKLVESQANVVLQVGGLFDAYWRNPTLPNVIYTDYTAHLSAQKPKAGRAPFKKDSWQSRRWRALERQAYERAVHICTRSELVKSSIVNDYGILPERVTVVGGGVNFEQQPEPKLEIKNTQATVLFIGRDFYRKGGDLVLRAFAQVRSQIPQARLLLLTRDAIPRDLPLEGIELISPDWNRQAIKDIYCQADLLVLPSRLETWGDVLLEAMAYGIPCIGVWDQAMREIIEDEVTGLLVPPEDVTALTKAMIRILSDTQLRYRFGRAAQQRVAQKYTWDHVVERLMPAIRTAVELSLIETRKGEKADFGLKL